MGIKSLRSQFFQFALDDYAGVATLGFVFLCALVSSCGRLTVSETDPDSEEVLSDGLPTNQHRVFVSSTTSRGNYGSLAAMDTACQALATSASLVRTYKVIASDSLGNSANTRLTINGPIYVFSSSSTALLVATSSADLWDLAISQAISYTQAYTNVGTASVWTGTSASGDSTGSDCNNWTSNSNLIVSSVGYTNLATDGWIEDLSPTINRCNSFRRIYCISQ